MARMGAFGRIRQLKQSRELCMSILVQGCALLKTHPKGFSAAVALSYKWLTKNGEKIAHILQEEYRKFFENYRGHKPTKGQEKYDFVEELRALFNFCR